MPSRRSVLVVLCLLAVGAGAGLNHVIKRRAAAPPQISGFLYPDAQPIGAFELTAHDRSPFGPQQLEGKWSFLYFGYTYCPDVCPTTLLELDKLQKLLTAENLDNDTQYLFVSVDPKRDTPERLAEYTRYFNPKFTGLTGNSEQLAALTKRIGVVYNPVPNESGTGYLVDHSSSVVLIDPDSQLHAVFSAPQMGSTMAEDFRKLHRSWKARR